MWMEQSETLRFSWSEMRMARPTPYKISIGVRYQPNFALQDALGGIVQSIIKEKDSPFNGAFNQVIEESPSRQRIIKAEKSKTYIKVSNTDIVYENFFDGDVEENFKMMMEAHVPYLFEVSIRRHRISEILRAGIIFGFRGDLKESADNVAKEITGGTVTSSDDFVLRFSRRIPDDKALAMKKIEDFKNIIVTLQRPQGSPAFTLDLDFQHYFVPDLEHPTDFDFIAFFRRAKQHVWTDFKSLLAAEVQK